MADEEAHVVALVEERRKERGLTQAEVAAACHMTQGHYSKLVRRRIDPGRRSTEALGRWLRGQGGTPPPAAAAPGLEALAAAIRDQCADLVRLARRAERLSRAADGRNSPR